MDYSFKKFEGRNVRKEDRITITRSFSVGFPQKFYEDNNIKQYKYVVFYYDESNRAIGIHFINEDTEKNKFTIMHSKEGYGGSVVARSFLKANSIEPLKYHGRYEWTKVEANNIGELFVIDLTSKK